MKSMKNIISANLRYLRNIQGWSQEDIAEKIGVSRQSVAKWENGETLPDILKCEALAELFNVTLDDLVRYNSDEQGLPIPPKNKHFFGIATIGERGQIVLPKSARETMGLKPGDKLVVLGDTSQNGKGIALIESAQFLKMTGQIVDKIFKE